MFYEIKDNVKYTFFIRKKHLDGCFLINGCAMLCKYRSKIYKDVKTPHRQTEMFEQNQSIG